jgi:hypothetical protein
MIVGVVVVEQGNLCPMGLNTQQKDLSSTHHKSHTLGSVVAIVFAVLGMDMTSLSAMTNVPNYFKYSP